MRKVTLPLTVAVLTLAAFAGIRAQECVSSPSMYAGRATWFINNAPLLYKRKTYTKYGLPRVLSATDVVSIGKYKKAGVFAEPGSKKTPEVIYLPVREGCEFQPYQISPTRPPRKKVRR